MPKFDYLHEVFIDTEFYYNKGYKVFLYGALIKNRYGHEYIFSIAENDSDEAYRLQKSLH